MITQLRPFEQPSTEPQNAEAGGHNQKPQRILGKVIRAKAISIGYIGPSTLPSQVLLGSLRDGRLRVYSVITIIFTIEGQHVIAEAVELREFGFGNNHSEAMADLQRAIAELYFTLEQEQERLGSDLQGVWVTLQQKIRKR